MWGVFLRMPIAMGIRDMGGLGCELNRKPMPQAESCKAKKWCGVRPFGQQIKFV